MQLEVRPEEWAIVKHAVEDRIAAYAEQIEAAEDAGDEASAVYWRTRLALAQAVLERLG